MRNKVTTKSKSNANNEENDDDDGLDDQKNQEFKTKNRDNREFN